MNQEQNNNKIQDELGNISKPLLPVVDLIFEEAIKLGVLLSDKMLEECDGDYVGEQQDIEFEFDGKNYIATVDAFWESSNHFGLSVKGVDNEYIKYKCCNSF